MESTAENEEWFDAFDFPPVAYSGALCRSCSGSLWKKLRSCDTCQNSYLYSFNGHFTPNEGADIMDMIRKQPQIPGEFCLEHKSPRTWECFTCKVMICECCNNTSHRNCQTNNVGVTLVSKQKEQFKCIDNFNILLQEKIFALKSDSWLLERKGEIMDSEIQDLEISLADKKSQLKMNKQMLLSNDKKCKKTVIKTRKLIKYQDLSLSSTYNRKFEQNKTQVDCLVQELKSILGLYEEESSPLHQNSSVSISFDGSSNSSLNLESPRPISPENLQASGSTSAENPQASGSTSAENPQDSGSTSAENPQASGSTSAENPQDSRSLSNSNTSRESHQTLRSLNNENASTETILTSGSLSKSTISPKNPLASAGSLNNSNKSPKNPKKSESLNNSNKVPENVSHSPPIQNCTDFWEFQVNEVENSIQILMENGERNPARSDAIPLPFREIVEESKNDEIGRESQEDSFNLKIKHKK